MARRESSAHTLLICKHPSKGTNQIQTYVVNTGREMENLSLLKTHLGNDLRET